MSDYVVYNPYRRTSQTVIMDRITVIPLVNYCSYEMKYV